MFGLRVAGLYPNPKILPPQVTQKVATAIRHRVFHGTGEQAFRGKQYMCGKTHLTIRTLITRNYDFFVAFTVYPHAQQHLLTRFWKS